MRIEICIALVVLTMSVSTRGLSPAGASAQDVFINEIHYDNTGTDEGEAIEVACVVGTDLTGWRHSRHKRTLRFTSPAT